MTILEMRDKLTELVDGGHGDKEIVVGFDDVPDYVSSLSMGGICAVQDHGETLEVLSTWYSNDGAYSFVTGEVN